MTNISNLSNIYNPLFPPQPTNNTPAKFSWFVRFPPEVQAIIFEFAAANDEPRFLELFTKTREAEQQRDLKIRHQVPALLHVSREARRWAKKYYIKLMGTSRCYLDPRKDVVFMQDTTVPKMYNSWIQHQATNGESYSMEVEKQVRYVVVGGETEYPSLADLTNCGFLNLEKIVLQKQTGGLDSRQQAHLWQNSWVRNDQTPQDVWRYASACPGKSSEVEFLEAVDLNKKTILEKFGLRNSPLSDAAEHEDNNSRPDATPRAENREGNDSDDFDLLRGDNKGVDDLDHVNPHLSPEHDSFPFQHQTNHTHESEDIPHDATQLISSTQHDLLYFRYTKLPRYNITEVIPDDIELDDKDLGSPVCPETEEEFAATAKIPPLKDSYPPNLAQHEPARNIPVSALREPTWDTPTLSAPTISSLVQGYIEYIRLFIRLLLFGVYGLPVHPRLQSLFQYAAPHTDVGLLEHWTCPELAS